jgi:hypothetical protein
VLMLIQTDAPTDFLPLMPQLLTLSLFGSPLPDADPAAEGRQGTGEARQGAREAAGAPGW